MNICIVGNNKAKETIERLKNIGETKFNITWSGEEGSDAILNYGISDFNIPKEEQALLFEEVLPNTILSPENYNILKDTDLIIMKNPTRILLWKDAKHSRGTKYLYLQDRIEWRINYSYGQVHSILNKNIDKTTLFGKADVTQWTAEENLHLREKLRNFVLSIARIVEQGSNLKSFGVDIIFDRKSETFYFLELNQANSLGEKGCEWFLKGYLEYLENQNLYKRLDEIVSLLSLREKEYLSNKLLDSIDLDEMMECDEDGD